MAGWYDVNWLYRKKIKIDHTKVAENLTDFPVLLSFDTDSELSANAQADGDDILITSTDGTTKLAHELLFFDSATGKTRIWFKAPSLSSTVDDDFYMYYGNSGASAQQDVTNVWPTSYKAVHHLDESTGNRNDSTVNANNMTPTSVSQVDGKIYKGASFNSATPSVLEASYDASLQITGNLTASFWMNPNQAASSVGEVQSKRDGTSQSYGTRIVDFGNEELGYLFTSTGADFRSHTTGAVDYTNNVWQLVHINIRFDGDRLIRFYSNGSEVHNVSVDSGVTQHYAGTEPFNLGARYTGSGYAGGYNGYLEESRIYSGILSAGWITTEYNNQNSPSTFYTITLDPEVSVTDSVSLAESVNVSVNSADTIALSVSDSISLTESITTLVSTVLVSSSESVGVAETVLVIPDLIIFVTDSVGVVDAPGNTTISDVLLSISDSVSVGETVSLFVETTGNTIRLYVFERINVEESISLDGAGHNSSLWRDITDLYGNTWTVSNDYKNDE